MGEKIKNKGITKYKIKSFLLYTLPFIIEYLFLQTTDFVDTTLSSHVGETTIVGISTMVLIIEVIRIFPKIMANTNKVKDKDGNKIDLPAKLFGELASKYAGRQGGYTRIYKMGPRRGDSAEKVIIELV